MTPLRTPAPQLSLNGEPAPRLLPRRSPIPRWGLAALLSVAAPGCVTRVYQPLSGLHDPVVVDPRLPNFRDTEIDVHCVPGDLLNEQEASRLCSRVGVLFENQGAVVRTHISAGEEEDLDEEAPPAEGEVAPEAPRTALSLELRARKVHASNHPLSWVLCLGSFTVLPGVTEATFAQDLVVRDATGFLLVSDSLEGRLVERFGFGPWFGNVVFDLWRDEADKVVGERASKELSADVYRQLSQRVFDAKMQAQVLEQAPAVGRAGVAP